ncbi:Concanavalin A-like lectin, partial [Candidatus Methanophagaceae archaeon]
MNYTINESTGESRNINVTESMIGTPKLIANKESFSLDEEPTFSFEYKTFRKTFIKNASHELLRSVNVSEDSGIVALEEPQKALKKWVTENERVETCVYDSSGALTGLAPEIAKTGEGKFAIKLPKARAFRAGVYTLNVRLVKDEHVYVLESEFPWGLVSVNTRKSIYKPGETAEFVIVVLDKAGHSVSNADMYLTVNNPKNDKTTYSTVDGTITASSECGIYNVDYHTEVEGNHTVSVTGLIDNVEVSFNTYFRVLQAYEFDLVRTAQSKIDPTLQDWFEVRIDVECFTDAESVTLKEFVPAEFCVYSTDAATVMQEGDTKTITWNKDLIGKKTSVSYSYAVPPVWPYLYALGPAEISYGTETFTFLEARPWYVAVDPISIINVQSYPTAGYVNQNTQLLYSSYWSNSKNVTVAHVNASGSAFTNYPALINVSKESAMQSDFDDIRFVTTCGGTMPFELEEPYTDYALFWVNITSLPTSGTSFWMYYGNDSASSASDPEAVWNSGYAMVQHLQESPANGTTGHIDSTSNNNNGTLHGFGGVSGSTTDGVGRIDGADEFNGLSESDYVDCGNYASLDITDNITISAWVKITSTRREEIFSKWKDSNPYDGYIFDMLATGRLRISTHEESNTKYRYRDSSISINDGQWHHIVGLRENKHIHFYIDGVLRDGTEITGAGGAPVYIGYSAGIFAMGGYGYGGADYFTGTIDEVRISNIPRTPDYILQNYEMVVNQTTMVTFGAAEAQPYLPPDPINLANTTGNFWVNHTWQAGSGNVTDSFNVSVNGTWTNDSALTYMNVTVGSGGWANITVWAWNASGTGTLSAGCVSDELQAPEALLTCTCGDICVNGTGWWRNNGVFNASSTRIQHAIDNAIAGDSIYVYNGSYTENVNASKQLTLTSEGADVVKVTNSTANSHVFNVSADYVNISGFNVTGATGNMKAGIYIGNGVGHCNSSDNTVSDNYIGIYLNSSSSDNLFANNTISNNTWDNYIASSTSVFSNNTLNGTAIDFTYCGDVSLRGVSSPASDPTGWNNIDKFINATNQSAGAWMFINFSYSDADVSGHDESSLKVWNYNGTAWVENGWNGTRYLDTANNVVGVNITSFSVFAPMGSSTSNNPPVVTLNKPQNGSFTSANWAILNATVYTNTTNNMTVYFYANNNSNGLNASEGLVYIGENVANGTTLTYNLTALPIKPSEDELVLLMHFDNRSEYGENTTHTYDFSGNGNNGSCSGTGCPTWNVTGGRFAGAFEFDGNDDINVGDVMPAGAYTKVAWVKRVAGENYNNIISGNDYHAFWAPTPFFRLSAGHGGGYTNVSDSVPLDVGKWYHVAVTFDPSVNGGQMVLYKNGVEVDNATGVATQGDSIITYIGRFNTDYNWKGTIDEAAIYNRTLSSDEILNHYRLGNGKYYWKVNASDSVLSNESDVWEFTVSPPPVISTYTPAKQLQIEDERGPSYNQSYPYLQKSRTLNASATLSSTDSVGGVRFIVDQGEAGETIVNDTNTSDTLFSAQFSSLSYGNHTLDITILNASRDPLPGSESIDPFWIVPYIIQFIGDSITISCVDDTNGAVYDLAGAQSDGKAATNDNLLELPCWDAAQSHYSNGIHIFYSDYAKSIYGTYVFGNNEAQSGITAEGTHDKFIANNNGYADRFTSLDGNISNADLFGPTHAYVMLGLNGNRTGVTESTYETQLSNVVNDTHNQSIAYENITLLYPTYSPTYDVSDYLDNIDNVSSNLGTRLIKDLYNETKANYNSGGSWYCTTDNVHFTRAGSRNISRIIAEKSTWLNTGQAIYTEFSGSETTNFNSLPDITNVSDATLQTNTAKITWYSNVNAYGANFDTNVDFGFAFVDVNASGLNSTFNSSANITLYSLSWGETPVIFKDGSPCQDCTINFYSGGNLSFNVTHFTNYSAGANA